MLLFIHNKLLERINRYMEWQIVPVKQDGGRTAPFVSIGRGSLEFNATAADLVKDVGNYKYAQILKAKDKGKVIIGVKFLEEPEEECIPIKRKVVDGKTIRGMTVANKGIVEELFGKDGSNNGRSRKKVELAAENILKIID